MMVSFVFSVDQTDDAMYHEALQTPPTMQVPQPEYHSFGLEALEMLHNQLQILVRAFFFVTL